MPKYTVKPLDAHGHPVIRAITSINDDAAEEEINQKVLAAAKRGGSKVANVLLINTLSEVVLAWSIVEGVAGPCDAGPFQPVMQPPDGVYRNLTNEPEVQQIGGEPVEAEVNQPAIKTTAHKAEIGTDIQAGPEGQTEEGQMAKRKSINKRKKNIKAGTKKVTQKSQSKKLSGPDGIIAGLLKSGCTTAEVLKATGWPTCSLPQQAKKAGLRIKKEKVKGKPTYYKAY